MSPPERDSLVREVQARRAAWRARGITHYRIRVTEGCFCPMQALQPVLEVRGGVAVALLDTIGRPAGPVREPWSALTVEGLFDFVERAVQTNDVVEVSYDACLGYPAAVRGDAKLGQVDDWFWLTAYHLTIPR